MSELQEESQISKKFNIAILGDATVGKTTITYRCLDKNLNPEETDTTLEDHYKVYPEINNEKIEVELIDTAGQDDYQNFFETWVQPSDGFLLIFAINDKKSFDGTKSRLNKIYKLKGKDIPIFIIGNKKDLENERQVLFKDAKNFGNENKIPYFETSALFDNENQCKNIFLELTKKINFKKFKTNSNENDNKKCCCYIF